MNDNAQIQEIKDLLEKIDQTYWGPEEREMLDRALTLSRDIGDEELEYQVRIRLTASAVRTGDNDTVLSSFAWCLAKHDADPIRFPTDVENGMADLMWQFKWMIGTLDASPIFSLEQGEAMLEEMEAHYLREGLGLSGVITARFQHAWNTGDLTKAAELRTLLATTPRDEHSHCDACGRSELSGFALEVDEEELALTLVDEIMEGGFSCGEEPEHALGRTLVAKLRAGRMEDALESHMRSYRLARSNPDNISIVADNMIFTAITGNEARGLAMVERHISWLAHDSLNEAGQLNMLTAVGVVLQAVLAAGYGEQVVRGANAEALHRFFGDQLSPWTVEKLIPKVWEAASRLSAAFDTRNKNTYVSDRVNSTRDLLLEHYDLPIVSEVFLPPTESPSQPSTAQQWLDLAEIYSYAGLTEAVEPLNHGVEGAQGAVRSRILQLLVASYVETNDYDQAKRVLVDRIDALLAEGRTLQAEIEKRCELALYGASTPEDLVVLEAELGRQSETPGEELADVQVTLAACLLRQEGDKDMERVLSLLREASTNAGTRASLKASALRGITMILAEAGDLEQAVGVSTEILGLEISDGSRASALTMRARIYGGLQRYDEGVVDADAALKIYAAYGVGKPQVMCSVLSSALLKDLGRFDDELSRLRYAMREAEQSEMDTVGIRYRLGNALIATGHPHEGVETLWEVLHEEENAGASPDNRADTCEALAAGFEAAHKYSNAVSMYDKAAELLLECDMQVNAANMLRRKANILRDFEIFDDALEAISKAWELVQNHDAPGMEVQVLEAYAFTKSAAGDATGIDEIEHAISIVSNDPDGPFTWKVADLVDSKGRVCMNLDKRDEAVACFLQAADGYAEVGDLVGAARAVHFAAQNLAGPMERPEDAIPIWNQALAHVEAAAAEGNEADGLRESILVKLAETLESLGCSTEAAEVRSRLSSP